MTRRQATVHAIPRAKAGRPRKAPSIPTAKAVRRGRAPRADRPSKADKLEQAILLNLGPSPKMYGNNPPKRQIRTIRLEDIKIDESYQRNFRLAHAQKIAEEFDIRKMGIPLVNDRNGQYFCVDGQHSIHAIKIVNSFLPGYLTSIECEVVDEPGPKEEARLFVSRNKRSKMPATSSFKANHRSGDADCIRVANVLHSRGLAVKGMKRRGTIPITCIVPVCWAYQMGVLEDFLDVVKATWGLIDSAFHVTVFHPIAAVLVKNRGRVDLGHLVKTLSKFAPAGLRSMGVTGGFTRTVRIANFVVNAYNKSAKKADRIELVGSSDI